jgi:hypothetical protein
MLATAAGHAAAAAGGRHVLLIQDTTEINYQAKARRKRDLGRVGNGTDCGLFVHPALVVDAADGVLLGLAGATIWRRHKSKAAHYQQQPIEEKESFRWIDTAQAAGARLEGAALITVVSDGEADIYEVFARLPDPRTHVLVRAHQDRALARTGRAPSASEPEEAAEAIGRLFARLAATPEAGRVSFPLAARPGRAARHVEVAVRFAPVRLRQPRRGADARDPACVPVWAVEAREVAPPPGEAPVVWRLLTSHAIGTLEEARGVIELYRQRWTIEQVFRTLKTQGLALEESLLADGRALENLAATALIAACQVMQLVQGRGAAGEGWSAELVFTPGEITVLRAVVRRFAGATLAQTNARKRGSLAWAAWAIARLGGWKGYASERPPGPITFVHGLQRFHAICEGYALASA